MFPYRNNILPYIPALQLAGPDGGASQGSLAMGHRGEEAVPVGTHTGPQKRWRLRAGKLQLPWSSTAVEYRNWSVFHFYGTFLHFPRKIFTENCSIKFHIQANKHKTLSGKIPSQTLLFTSVNLGFCFSSLLVKKSLWRIPLWDLYFRQLGLYIYTSWQLFPSM